MSHNEKQHELTTQRIEAFSDGVFAIAITLLVLEIRVPHVLEAGGTATEPTSLAAALLPLAIVFWLCVQLCDDWNLLGQSSPHLLALPAHRPLLCAAERAVPDVHLVRAIPHCRARRIHRPPRPTPDRGDVVYVCAVSAGDRLAADVALRQPRASSDRPRPRPAVCARADAPVHLEQSILPGRLSIVALEWHRRHGCVRRALGALSTAAGKAALPLGRRHGRLALYSWAARDIMDAQ